MYLRLRDQTDLKMPWVPHRKGFSSDSYEICALGLTDVCAAFRFF